MCTRRAAIRTPPPPRDINKSGGTSAHAAVAGRPVRGKRASLWLLRRAAGGQHHSRTGGTSRQSCTCTRACLCRSAAAPVRRCGALVCAIACLCVCVRVFAFPRVRVCTCVRNKCVCVCVSCRTIATIAYRATPTPPTSTPRSTRRVCTRCTSLPILRPFYRDDRFPRPHRHRSFRRRTT